MDKKGENGYKYAKENFDRTVLAKKYIKEIEISLSQHKHQRVKYLIPKFQIKKIFVTPNKI